MFGPKIFGSLKILSPKKFIPSLVKRLDATIHDMTSFELMLKSVAPINSEKVSNVSICMRKEEIEICKFWKMCQKNLLKAFNISK